jgi:hypothetical protein
MTSRLGVVLPTYGNEAPLHPDMPRPKSSRNCGPYGYASSLHPGMPRPKLRPFTRRPEFPPHDNWSVEPAAGTAHSPLEFHNTPKEPVFPPPASLLLGTAYSPLEFYNIPKEPVFPPPASLLLGAATAETTASEFPVRAPMTEQELAEARQGLDGPYTVWHKA